MLLMCGRYALFSPIEALIVEVETLAARGETTGATPASLLCALDRVDDLVREIETRVVTSRSPFAKRVRWALSLRESLLEKTN